MRKHIYLTATLLLSLLNNMNIVNAAGFNLVEQSATMGNAFAGGAATAEDASTIYFNPAGMTYLPENQVVISAHAARPVVNFNNDGSHTTSGPATSGGDGGDGGSWAFIPNIYFEKTITPDVRLGIGLSSLFGLKTEYDKDWVGRYQAIKSDLKTISMNPSIAFKANDHISLGFGVSAMRAEAELTNAVDFGTLTKVPSLFQKRDGLASIKGNDWGFGWNAGTIWQVSEGTRIGLSYRSQIHQRLDGTVSFSNVPGKLASNPAFARSGITAKLVTPDSLNLSIFHKLNNQWDISGDIVWTGWSTFKNLSVVRDNGKNVASIPQNWENAIRVAAGAAYQFSDALKLRAGIAYDESPVLDKFRNPRIPDSDRIWLSLGSSYKITPTSNINFAYTHIFFKTSTQNKLTDSAVPTLRDTLKGNYDNYANILSAQYNYSF